uniref:Stress inducible protein coi6.1 n=1 Tax=Zea mays TaxID=4577 RepID=A0A804LGX8_MAIZE
MSRCFPYPPPVYLGNPVAVAEAESTAKKERERAHKKKDKRSDKKAPQLGETSKHSKHNHKKRKLEDVSTGDQEPKKVFKESAELLEKSGLSEEHGAPCFVQMFRDSPESSQDSSKRRKAVLPSPSQAKNGNIIRIKLKSNQDPQSVLLEKPRVLEQPLVQQMSSVSSLSSKQNSINRKVNVRSTAGQQWVNGDSQAVQKSLVTETLSRAMQRTVPQPAVKVTRRADPQLSVKAPVGRSDLPPKFSGSVGPSPARVTGRFCPAPVKTQQRIEHPPSMVSQRVDPQAKVSQKEMGSAVCLPQAPHPPVLQKPKDLPVPKQREPINSLPKEEPCFSGRTVEADQGKEAKLSRSDRKKIHKTEKKNKKFRDLFVTWNPLLMENEGSDLGGQDWLFSSTRSSDGSMAQPTVPDGLGPIHPMVQQQPYLQPRATFLPDLHIYQLPYVVPF